MVVKKKLLSIIETIKTSQNKKQIISIRITWWNQSDYMVEPILSVTGGLGGGTKNLKEDVKLLV